MNNEVFFADKGITSTSANHICNLAKESIRGIQKSLERVSFINETVRPLNGGNEEVLSSGVTDFPTINDMISLVGKYNAMIAWFREAIKAKEKAIDEINDMSIDYWAKEIACIEMPTYKEQLSLSEQDILDSFDVAKRCKYYDLEAQCAFLGKLIHPDGAIARARNNVFSSKEKEIGTIGDMAVVYSFIPSLNLNDLDEWYMELQKTHRALEAQLNGMKHEIKEKRYASMIEAQNANRVKFEEYSKRQGEIAMQFQEWSNKEAKRIGDLKIVVPNQFKELVDSLQGAKS